MTFLTSHELMRGPALVRLSVLAEHTLNKAVYSSASSFISCSHRDSRSATAENLQPPEFFLGLIHNPASASGLIDTHAYIQTFQKPPTDITHVL